MTFYKQGSESILVDQAVDEERASSGDFHGKREGNAGDDSNTGTSESEKLGEGNIFSWKNIQYEVPVSRGKIRRLLDNVSGYVAPGKLTALMGETGAGKVGNSRCRQC